MGKGMLRNWQSQERGGEWEDRKEAGWEERWQRGGGDLGGGRGIGTGDGEGGNGEGETGRGEGEGATGRGRRARRGRISQMGYDGCLGGI